MINRNFVLYKTVVYTKSMFIYIYIVAYIECAYRGTLYVEEH